jgi:hypothetical protein
MVLAMATATVSRVDGDEVEERRRSLMAESDCLLDDVERLRLDDHVEIPQPLREASAVPILLSPRRHSTPRTTSSSLSSSD